MSDRTRGPFAPARVSPSRLARADNAYPAWLYRSVWRSLRGLSRSTKRRLLWAAILLGSLTGLFYYSWWFEPEHGGNLLLAPLLLVAVVYNALQVFAAWYIYAHIDLPPRQSAPPGLRVDVLVPVYDEEYELVARSLAAAVDIRYPHQTFLLDDAHCDAFRELANRLGAVYLRRSDHRDAKAGNVNHALTYCDGEFVTIFDVDHVPAPHFLDAVLGYFSDPQVGFVQALVAHSNQRESFVANAVAAQAYDVFSPTSMGMYGCGAATVWGAHCTFRRAALDNIGGHQVGLAEDLNTSLTLHAAGWRSVYVPEVVARGLVPADLRAYLIQQLKWSHGVFEILVQRSLPRLLHLSPSQAICYATRMSYYLIGPVTFLSMVAVGAMLFLGEYVAQDHLASYIVHFVPVTAGIMLVRTLAVSMWEQDPEAGLFHYPGLALAIGTWPVYTYTFACALLRIHLPHLPTPKRAQSGHFLPLVVPQLAMVAFLLAGIVWRAAHGLDLNGLIIVGFALLLVVSHWAVFYATWEGRSLRAGVQSEGA